MMKPKLSTMSKRRKIIYVFLTLFMALQIHSLYYFWNTPHWGKYISAPLYSVSVLALRFTEVQPKKAYLEVYNPIKKKSERYDPLVGNELAHYIKGFGGASLRFLPIDVYFNNVATGPYFKGEIDDSASGYSFRRNNYGGHSQILTDPYLRKKHLIIIWNGSYIIYDDAVCRAYASITFDRHYFFRCDRFYMSDDRVVMVLRQNIDGTIEMLHSQKRPKWH